MDPRTIANTDNTELRAELASLEGRIKAHATAAQDFEHKARTERSEIGRLQQHVNTIQNELERRNRPAPVPRVTEHALLRFVERICNIDTEVLRASILTKPVIEAIQAGASAVTVSGVKFIVKDNVIVTTFGEREKPAHKKVKAGRDPVSEDALIAAGIADYEEDLADEART